MLTTPLKALIITIGLAGPAMSQEHILISSDWGEVTADLADNDAAKIAASDVASHDPNG
jgi:hypothetical protein